MKKTDMLKRFAVQLSSTKIVLTIGLFLISTCGQSVGRTQTDLTEVENNYRATIIETIENVVTANGLSGAAVIIKRDGETILEHSIGEYSLDTQVPIASATKWVTAALIMTVVERDGLSLDAPLSSYLSDVRSDLAGITLRQMLSHTSGMAGDHALNGRTDVPMVHAVDQLLAHDLVDSPGASLIYGGASIQIAGFVAVAHSKTDWQDLFQSRLAKPLGWQDAYWDHPLRTRSGLPVSNPNLGAGLHASAREYIAFLDMISNDGSFAGQAILNTQSIAEILHDQTEHASKDKLPALASTDWGYGLGCWCVEIEIDGSCNIAQSAGAFGTYPWIDARTGTYGVVMLRGRLPSVLPDLQMIRELARNL